MSDEILNDEDLAKIMKGNFDADLLDAEGKCVARGQVRLKLGSNTGNFWANSLDPKLDAQILGSRPKVLLQHKGPAYNIDHIELGDMPNASRYFKVRLSSLGSPVQG